MTFSSKLQAERKRLALTQVEAAKLLGIPARTYWEYESGTITPAKITQEGALARLAAPVPDGEIADSIPVSHPASRKGKR